MTFEERNKQEMLLYKAFKGIKYVCFHGQQGLESDFLNQFTDNAIHMIIGQMIDNGVRFDEAIIKAEPDNIRNSFNYIVECCPHCNTENEIRWDIEPEGYEAFCPHCGKPMMLCGECLSNLDNQTQKCDWSEGKCFRCKQEEKNEN